MGYVARFPFGVTNGDGTMAAVSALSHEMFEGEMGESFLKGTNWFRQRYNRIFLLELIQEYKFNILKRRMYLFMH